MTRRLYFLLPDTGHARTVVNDLQEYGVAREAMHTLARPGINLAGLPDADSRQGKDSDARMETLLWDGNLVLFVVALVLLLVMVYRQLDWYWLLVPGAIMLATLLLGVAFTSRIPNVHLAEFQDAMHHREILLMVDVPVWRVANVESRVHRHHPEAVTSGGGGWHSNIFHV
jgi:hypothetical protein